MVLIIPFRARSPWKGLGLGLNDKKTKLLIGKNPSNMLLLTQRDWQVRRHFFDHSWWDRPALDRRTFRPTSRLLAKRQRLIALTSLCRPKAQQTIYESVMTWSAAPAGMKSGWECLYRTSDAARFRSIVLPCCSRHLESSLIDSPMPGRRQFAAWCREILGLLFDFQIVGGELPNLSRLHAVDSPHCR